MIENNAKPQKKLTKKAVLNSILDILETVFISAFVITMFFTFVLRMAIVKGESMVPTLYPDERILVFSWDTDYKFGDIIVIDCQESVVFSDDGQLEYRDGLGKQIIKRVIAAEGQVLDIDFEKGFVYVDGKLLNELYITGLTHVDEGAFTGKYPFRIPEGYVFVLGDNRGISRDSRDIAIGLVSEESIVGKAVMRISPMNKFGFIE